MIFRKLLMTINILIEKALYSFPFSSRYAIDRGLGKSLGIYTRSRNKCTRRRCLYGRQTLRFRKARGIADNNVKT